MIAKPLLAAALVMLTVRIATSPAHAIDGGRYGEVRLTEPEGDMRGLVILFSDRGGRSAVEDAAAGKLAQAGALVVEVDTDAYLAGLNRLDDKCQNLGGDAEGLSRNLQHDRGYATYRSPILAGIGVGGALAGAALTQVPSATFAGAVSLDPTVAIATRRPFCPGAHATAVAGGFSYGPFKALQGFWTVGFSESAPKPARNHVAALSIGGTPVEIEEIQDRPDPADAIARLILPHLDRADAETSGVGALPLIELPVDKPSPLMAIVLSGDGGWRDLDKAIAETLQHQGVPVVGWDCLRYFWSKKTPDETAKALAAVMKTYMAKWHADKVALIGYSFGADVLPFAYNRLPEALRPRVSQMSLLGLAKAADFEISVGGWLGTAPSADALPAMPEVERLPPHLIQCFYGVEEDDTACPDLAAKGIEIIRTTGGHHFDGNYPALAHRILDGVKRREG